MTEPAASNDPRPRLWSRRFWRVVRLSLAGDPGGCASGLYWYLTRRRVRGWGRLLVAASFARQAYSRWVGCDEERAFASYRETNPNRMEIRPCVLILCVGGGEGDSAIRTVQSARAAFGEDVAIRCSHTVEGLPPALPGDLAAALDELARSGCKMVLPLLAGDILSADAADVLGRAFASAPEADLVYWDEDAVEEGRRSDPWIKPDWDPLLFGRCGGLAGASAMPLPAAIAAARRCADLPLDRDGMERLEFELCSGPQTFVAHVPLILTHRAQRNRLALDLGDLALVVRAVQKVLADAPSVSLIVPTRDRPDLLAACLRGIAATDYPDRLELVIVDNGTVDAHALRLIADVEAGGAKVIRDAGAFNFSRLCNAGAEAASGDFLCFYNNDVEPLHPDWLQRMMDQAVDDRVGAVGALLLYPSGRIQHAGVVVGLGGAAGHVQKGARPDDRRFRTWHGVTREVSAVTAAVMVVRASHFDAVEGFDETAFPVAFNDVDLCLRLKARGLRNLYVAEARLLHRESESRGDDRRPARAAKFAAEMAALQNRWHTRTFDDPHFSPLFVKATGRCILAI